MRGIAPVIDALHRDIAPQHLRMVMGQVPTGVTVAAALDDGRPVGSLVVSLFPVSFDPPLVGLCIPATSAAWEAVTSAGRVGISVLAADQTEDHRHIGAGGPGQFDTVCWSPGPLTGSPLLDGAAVRFDCRLEAQYPAGDQWLAIARVLHMAARNDARAMVFCGQRYGRHEPFS